jgi:hypothetical protein
MKGSGLMPGPFFFLQRFRSRLQEYLRITPSTLP